MKHKLSVSLDERLVQELDRVLSTGKYRNKSHAVEFAVRKLLDTPSSTNSAIPLTSMQNRPEAKNG